MNINEFFGVPDSDAPNDLLKAVRAHIKAKKKIPNEILVLMLQHPATEIVNKAVGYILKNMKNDVFSGLNIPANVNKDDLFVDAVTTFWQYVRFKNRNFDASNKNAIVGFLRVVCWRLARPGGTRPGQLPEEYKLFEQAEVMDIILTTTENRALLLKKFDTLGKGCKEILRLFYYERYSFKEIAAMTGYGIESARVRRNRCIGKLKQQIAQNDDLGRFIRDLLM